MSSKTPAQVRDIARAIRNVSREQFRNGYNRIDPKSYGMELSEEDFEYTWESFSALPDFWFRAASSGSNVLFTADQ